MLRLVPCWLRRLGLAGALLLTLIAPAFAESKAQIEAERKRKAAASQPVEPSFVAGYVMTAAMIGLALALISAPPKRKDAGAAETGDLW